jgi:hypothetical protein
LTSGTTVQAPARTERSLASYLVLPRPGDIGKAVIIPIGFVIGAVLSSPPSGQLCLRALIVWFAVEYLAYQARYQWNDIRGFECDQAHPDRVERGRLPGPVERGPAHIRLSATVLIGRVALALLPAAALPGLHLAAPLIAGVVGVFAAAVMYETVRSRADRHPVRERPAPMCVALWLVAGAGYCVRGLTGVVLGLSTAASTPALIAAGGAFWTAGIMFVTSRWAVESLPFAHRTGSRLVWSAGSELGRGHLIALSRWLPHDAGAAPEDLRSWRPLTGPTAWSAPWNVALFAALSLAAAAGVALAGQSAHPAGVGLIVLSVVVAWNVLVRHPQLAVAVVTAVGALAVAGAVGSVALAVPAAAVCLLYVLCARQCLAGIGRFGQGALRLATDGVRR